MFTVEIRINGALIGHIYGTNTRELGAGVYEYRYEYYEPDVRKLIKGRVTHLRSSGVRPLINAVLSDVTKQIDAVGRSKS